MFNKKIVAALSLGIAALTATPVAAQTTVTVATADLELGSAAGQRTLDARLKGAVRDVCGVTPTLRDLHDVRSYRSCVAGAEASFMDQRRIAIANAQGGERMAANDQAQSANAG